MRCSGSKKKSITDKYFMFLHSFSQWVRFLVLLLRAAFISLLWLDFWNPSFLWTFQLAHMLPTSRNTIAQALSEQLLMFSLLLGAYIVELTCSLFLSLFHFWNWFITLLITFILENKFTHFCLQPWVTSCSQNFPHVIGSSQWGKGSKDSYCVWRISPFSNSIA